MFLDAPASSIVAEVVNDCYSSEIYGVAQNNDATFSKSDNVSNSWACSGNYIERKIKFSFAQAKLKYYQVTPG